MFLFVCFNNHSHAWNNPHAFSHCCEITSSEYLKHIGIEKHPPSRVFPDSIQHPLVESSFVGNVASDAQPAAVKKKHRKMLFR